MPKSHSCLPKKLQKFFAFFETFECGFADTMEGIGGFDGDSGVFVIEFKLNAYIRFCLSL
ncbi:MAG: hypothetical protein KU28_10470 [Sulfurovum sp. PC08-66]|nr:MAG: hypothetical protein KU28_10470 [Sulfurovum sp. PC08-66]